HGAAVFGDLDLLALGSGGIRGPIGLGFRVPCFVISPYSRGPQMVHDTFDHTSERLLLDDSGYLRRRRRRPARHSRSGR
ncbi:hypothetical protein KCW65_29815, partial [Mycobacterium tuberculosis]|nr:hypothetical protein [Mycobacterium tuberculosis]